MSYFKTHVQPDLKHTMFKDEKPKVKYKKPAELTMKNRKVTRIGGHFQVDDLEFINKSATRKMNKEEN
jgi:hypothetical protein